MIFFADSSFLASLYLVDANGVAAERSIQTLNPTLPLTEFGAFELKNAVWAAVFRKAITVGAAEVALRRIERDLTSGFLVSAECVWKNVFQTAESLSRRHTRLVGCRALDVLQVASAVVLGCRQFLTLDQRQSQLARQAGLQTPA